MTSETVPVKHLVRRVIGYLIPAGPIGDGTWRFRFTTVLALVGPGSVPFGMLMFGTQYAVLRSNYYVDSPALLALGTAAAVVIARFRPFEAWLLVMAVFMGTIGVGDVSGWEPWPLTTPSLLALFIVLFALGRDRPIWLGALAWLGYVGAGSWAHWAVASGRITLTYNNFVNDNPATENVLLGSMLGALMLLAGMTVRIWRQGRARVAEEERVAETERHRRRLLEERTRIARELHDVVAHHMSVIAVQASTAEYRLAGLSEEAEAEFRSISEQARESLAEMRRLLGVLRSEDESAAREPQPGPEGLRGLAEAVDRAGTPVDLRIEELPADLSETLALTVFRVVQEALSNVVRHAPGASATVEVAAGEREVAVTVENGPSPTGAVGPDPHGSGLGLVGMGERVVIEGGTLETGPTEGGGFRVHAVLPVEARPTAEEAP